MPKTLVRSIGDTLPAGRGRSFRRVDAGSAVSPGRLDQRPFLLPRPARRTTQDPVDLLTVDRLSLEEEVDQAVEAVAVVREQAGGPSLGLAEQARDLLVDEPLGLLRERPALQLLAP